jgi:TolB-like protein/Flp pilus assembly protein TadD
MPRSRGSLTGRVVAVKVEADGDIHIALTDATGDKQGIVVAEIPLGPQWCDIRTTVFSWTPTRFPFQTRSTKRLKVIKPPIITVIGKAFWDIGHAPKDQSNRRKYMPGYSVWEIRQCYGPLTADCSGSTLKIGSEKIRFLTPNPTAGDVSSTQEPHLHLEVGHILFLDIVGYSKLLSDEQKELVQELNQIVRETEQFRAAEAEGKLTRLPTGDGMVLVFTGNPEAPVECALEISKALQSHPNLKVRMGIHSGPVNPVADVNDQVNLLGAGINVAQRVMYCGDAGHILLSKHFAEDLEHYAHWRPHLHDVGTVEAKHGARIPIVNFYTDKLGNSALPAKLRRAKTAFRFKSAAVVALLLIAVLGIGFWMLHRSQARFMNAAGAIPSRSIAVLPFENLSEDKANAYFADGIQEEILTRLATIADLKVISRTSTQQYQGKPHNLREIAKQLGVANVLEGSVQKAVDQVRVNVQLLNAQTDSHLWAETYDRKLTDIFSLESEIAKGIAESLQSKLTGREERALAVVRPTNNPEAYDAFLHGLAFDFRSRTLLVSIDLVWKAAGLYERAVQLDPNFAIAWARLSRADALLYFNGEDTTPATRRAEAKRALENAQKLDPNSPETLLALGYYQYWVLRDYGPAKTTFGRVSKALPGNSEVPVALGYITRREGQWDQSIAYFQQALALDPRNVELLIDTASTHGMLRRFPAALELYDRVLDITPNDPDVMAAKGAIYQAQGNLQEAARLLSEINWRTRSEDTLAIKIGQLRLERNYAEAVRLLQARQAQFHFDSERVKGREQVVLALTQRLAGDMAAAKATAEQARDTLEKLYRDQPDNAFVAAPLSQAYAAMGAKDSALKEAQRAIMLLPRAKDPVIGPAIEENLAFIQTIFGENRRAISTLTQLLQTPYNNTLLAPPIVVTPALLRLDPLWDPLRADPAFQKLCEEKQP